MIYVRIGAMLLDIPGVVDFSGLALNGGTTNIVIATGEVAVAGDVTFSE